MEIKIIYKPDPSPSEIKTLESNLSHYAQLMKNQPPIESFSFLIFDDNNEIIGGCNGTIYYGCLDIDQLWIDETLRRKKIGSQLIHLAEQLGQSKGCFFSIVSTMDWEALEFYLKQGYEIEYKREGYFHNSIAYLLRKNFIL
ncbi:TPA: GNAT family N-acetyltransferase [Legionella pneumophila]|nr:GNAT family N-acetyltransferase [Legionella pneumophila]